MKIRFKWPDKIYEKQSIDAYWVECSPDEAWEEVFPYLSDDEICESMEAFRPNELDLEGNPSGYCFLVSEDLCHVQGLPWFFPYSGMWNANCPFQRIEERTLNNKRRVPQRIARAGKARIWFEA